MTEGVGRGYLPGQETREAPVNLIVRPDGTAELDNRDPLEVVTAVLGRRGVVAVKIITDNTHVGTAYTLVAHASDANQVAELAMVHLTGRHFEFLGPVVFTGLGDGLAHLLLEMARDR